LSYAMPHVSRYHSSPALPSSDLRRPDLLRQQPVALRRPRLSPQACEARVLIGDRLIQPRQIGFGRARRKLAATGAGGGALPAVRSEEHTSELQSRRDLVCRIMLE